MATRLRPGDVKYVALCAVLGPPLGAAFLIGPSLLLFGAREFGTRDDLWVGTALKVVFAFVLPPAYLLGVVPAIVFGVMARAAARFVHKRIWRLALSPVLGAAAAAAVLLALAAVSGLWSGRWSGSVLDGTSMLIPGGALAGFGCALILERRPARSVPRTGGAEP
jgi:hypothetical protein